MNIPRHRKGMGWGYGVGLLALMITTVIGLYIYAKSIEAIAPTGNPADNVYNRTQKQINEIQDTLNRQSQDIDRTAGMGDGPRKVRYALVLLDPGAEEARVAEAIQAITTMNAEKARDVVKSAPMEIKGHMDSSEAESARKIFESLGARVSVREEQDQDKS